ncbi:hypothetical protein IGI04_003150 [Brassica rapa subsp. trilocularis]|uniref:Uncharacterized protein n=1 Tax=Brassica rapa subsp. trilocularis TaxID=1813537 RepID=A0ABQ7NXK8_BRACM|nr:hypothetical protein IGI04_003150 [Brassica rapa subsp. trilocularis]
MTVPGRAEQPECLFQRQKFLRKLQPLSGFSLISLFSLPAACGFDISSFSKPYSRTPLLGFAILKRETAPSLSSREDYPEPSFCYVILMQYYSVLMLVFSCVMAE